MKVDIAEIARQNGKKGSIEIKQQPVAKIEAVQYFKTLNKLTKAMRKDVREQLMPLVKSLEKQYANDGYADQISQMVATLSLKYGNVTNLLAKPTASKMVRSVTDKNTKGFNASVNKAVGVDLSGVLADEGLNDFLEAQVNKNVGLIKSIPDEYFKSIETTIMNGTIEGLRWEEIAKQVGGIKDISSVNGKLQNRIKLIARNETSNINASINKRRQENLGIEKFKWQTAQDERVRTSHVQINGNVYAWDNLPTVDGVKTSPGIPINCFPGNSKLNNTPFTNIFYRRFYRGELTSIVFSDGIVLRATPNHPILTDKGFKAISLIDKSDNVIRTFNEDINIIKHYGNDAIPTMGQVFNSLILIGAKKTISASLHGEFHGDISDSDIDIIRLDSFLWDDVESSINKKFSKLNFSRSEEIGYRKLFSCDGSFGFFFSSRDSSFCRNMAIPDLRIATFLAHLTPLECFSLALGSSLNTILGKDSSNNISANSKMFSDFIFAFSCLVHGNNILRRKYELVVGGKLSPRDEYSPFPDSSADKISRDPNFFRDIRQGHTSAVFLDTIVNNFTTDFSSHIYNLETNLGYYSVSNTIVSNCRCVAIPVIEL